MNISLLPIAVMLLVVAPVAFLVANRLKRRFEAEVAGRDWAWHGRWSIRTDDPVVKAAFRRYLLSGVPLIGAVFVAIFVVFGLMAP